MQPKVRFALFLAAGIGAFTLCLGAFFLSNPIGISQWIARGALERMDLEKMSVETRRGPQTYYRGGSSPKTLVLVHGLGQRASSWVNGVPTLMTRYRLLVLDLAGHGESEPMHGVITLDDLLLGLTETLDQATPDAPVTLVGHGIGAWVSMLYALEHPDRVERLVLVNGDGLSGDGSGIAEVPENREQAARLFEAISPEGAPLPAGFVLDDLVEKTQNGPAPRVLAGLDENLRLDDRLGDIRVPVEILWGADDRLRPLADGRRFEAGLPRARLRELPGCGHLPHQQCTGPFLDALFEQLALDPVPAPAVDDSLGHEKSDREPEGPAVALES